MIFDLRKSFKGSARNFTLLGISKAVTQMLHLATLALITHTLGPKVYGQMSVFLMLTQFIHLVTTSWTGIGYTRFSILHAENNKPVSEVFWARNAIVVPFLLLAGGLLALFRQPLSAYLDLPPVIVLVAIFHVLSLLGIDYTKQIAQVTTRFSYISALQVVEKIIILGIVWFWGEDIFSILILIIAATLLSRCFFLFRIPASVYFPFRIRPALSRQLLHFSFPLFFVSVGGFILGWVDIAVIKHFAEFDDVGIYSLAYNGLSAVESFVLLMPSIMTPIVVAIISQDKRGQVARFAERMIPQITSVWGFGFIFIGPISVIAVPLVFGAQFAASVDVFLVLLMCLNLSVFNALCMPLFIGYDLVLQMATVNFAASILNLLLDIVMVPRFGIMGAAISTIISYLFIAVAYLVIVRTKQPGVTPKHFSAVGILFLQILFMITSKQPLILIGVTLAAVSAYLWAIRQMGIFKMADVAIYEQFDMPLFVKNFFSRICRYHG